jgi:hypothetical protein
MAEGTGRVNYKLLLFSVHPEVTGKGLMLIELQARKHVLFFSEWLLETTFW